MMVFSAHDVKAFLPWKMHSWRNDIPKLFKKVPDFGEKCSELFKFPALGRDLHVLGV